MQAENLCREACSRMARHRLPAKLQALGDSAANGALRLLKPQFSPTRNAPLSARFGVAARERPNARKPGFRGGSSAPLARFCPVLDTVEATCTQTDARYRRGAAIRRK